MPDEQPPVNTEPSTPAASSSAAPAAGVAAVPRGKPGPKGPRGPEIRIPQPQFKARVQREANSVARTTLGMSLEEAKVIIEAAKSGKSPQGDTASAPQVNAALVKLEQENAKLRQKADAEARRATVWESKHKKDTTRLKDRQVEMELRVKAAQAGVQDPDYAIHLFAKAASAGATTDPDAFFGGLKGTHVYLFAASPVAAPPRAVDVPVTTAPPESRAPGEETPSPAATGAATPNADTDKMSPQDFARHARTTYGFVPGA